MVATPVSGTVEPTSGTTVGSTSMSGESYDVFGGGRRRAQVRLFTVDEAKALLPRLLPVLQELRDMRHEVIRLRARLEQLTPAMRQDGHAAEASEIEQTMVAVVQRLTRHLETVTSLGVLIKDMDRGLVDFPAMRDDRVVLLCWRMDEPTIAYWHEVDAGFSGRQPL